MADCGSVTRKLAGTVLILLLTVQAVELYGHAYPELETAVPRPGSTLRKAPCSVCVRFNNMIQRNLSRIVVSDEQGEVYQTGELKIRRDNTVCAQLRLLIPSTYRVDWSVVGRDGHRTEGHYNFVLH